MEKPKSPQKSPYKVKVEKGKIYFWCACGLSNKQPFCDGTHKIEGKFKALKYLADGSKDIYFCGCKLSMKSPFCDGSHSKL
jgi:CDGSH-type Zn-finger protein